MTTVGIRLYDTPAAAAEAFSSARFISTEFMYQPRPRDARTRQVFDFALQTRLAELSECDAVLLVCASETVLAEFDDLPGSYPHLRFGALITNPPPYEGQPGDTPQRLGWDAPETWARFALTDRWARILAALDVGRRMADTSAIGGLLMPAHDAVWGRGLLHTLERFSRRHAQNGQPAAVSPYTPYQHAPVPGVDIPREIIDALNAAFGRDAFLAWKMRLDRVQAFWGKMSLLPYGLCAPVIDRAERRVWEDDLEIDRALREAGCGVRALWVSDPRLYRQALPVFDRDGLKRVIERTLHYSLNIPKKPLGASTLNTPLSWPLRLRRLIDGRYRRANALAEALIAECMDEIRTRLERTGASWVDWGAYRYVIRVGDPFVEVWGRGVIKQE